MSERSNARFAGKVLVSFSIRESCGTVESCFCPRTSVPLLVLPVLTNNNNKGNVGTVLPLLRMRFYDYGDDANDDHDDDGDYHYYYYYYYSCCYYDYYYYYYSCYYYYYYYSCYYYYYCSCCHCCYLKP